MPDVRLGERACAFVVLNAGFHLTFDAMLAYLEEKGMAKSYFPERLEIVPELPRTATGKIQKYKLRESASRFAEVKAGERV
jgi:cyclohexanecarboxylate-CoA ligase